MALVSPARGRPRSSTVDRRHLDAQVEAVHQRAGDAAEVFGAAFGDAGAGAGGVGEVAAAAGVGGGDQHEAAGIADVGVGAGDHDVAGLDRLAQGLEHGARELRQLVEEEDAVVGEADLAGLRAAAAADDRRHRGGVVRGAEGAGAGDAALVEEAGEGVDHRGLERLGGLERRQDAGKARGEHRLAAAGRADHQQVVAAGGGDLERALGLLLALDLGEVLVGRGVRHGAGLGGRERGAAGEVVDEGEERLRRDHLDGADPGRLGAAGRRGRSRPQSASAAASAAGSAPITGMSVPSRESSPSATWAATSSRGQDLHGGEERERDRQVEVRAFLGEVGGREVDGDALGGEREAHGGHRRADPLLGLGDRLVGEADEVEGRQAGGDGALHLDEARLDALECHRVGARDHVPARNSRCDDPRGGALPSG